MQNPGIYILTCRVNGKQYIGLDKNLPSRSKAHLKGSKNCRLISRAIEKHGAENFDVEIIRYPGISREALCAVEQWKIAQLNSKFPNGYNLTDGGDGNFGWQPTEETKKRIGKASRNRDPKSNQQISETLKGNVPWNKGKRGKQVAWNKGKSMSEEQRQKLSEASKRLWADPEFRAKHTGDNHHTRKKKGEIMSYYVTFRSLNATVRSLQACGQISKACADKVVEIRATTTDR